MRVLVVTPPGPIVNLAEAKEHLKVENNAEDALIAGMLSAATSSAAHFIQRSIGTQTLEARFDVYESCNPLRLPFPPVIKLVSVKWLDANRQLIEGSLADVEAIDREVHPLGTAPWTGCCVGRDVLRIAYQAGYDQVPDDIRSAILLMTGHLYHNRGAVTADPPAAIAVLLQPYRVFA